LRIRLGIQWQIQGEGGAAAPLLTGCISKMVKILQKMHHFCLKFKKKFLCPLPDLTPTLPPPLFPSSRSAAVGIYSENNGLLSLDDDNAQRQDTMTMTCNNAWRSATLTTRWRRMTTMYDGIWWRATIHDDKVGL